MGVPAAVDTHAHLVMGDFDADRPGVIERAKKCDVSSLEVGCDLLSSARAVALARELGGKCAVGIHPHYAGKTVAGLEAAWKRVEEIVETAGPLVVAVGEIGLDFARNLVPMDIQMQCFGAGLDLARRRNMPVIVHQRDATREVLSMVRRARPSAPVIFHCFTGDGTYARDCLDLGGFIGVGGVLTYPRNGGLRETVRGLPGDRLLLETDSPYLPPQSRRGRRNEPAFVLEVRDLLAGLKGVSRESIGQTTWENSRRAFMAEIAWTGRRLPLEGHRA